MILYAGVFGAAGGQLLLHHAAAPWRGLGGLRVDVQCADHGRLLAVVLLGEPLRLPLIIGLVLVSVGVRLATQRASPRARLTSR